MRKRSAFAESYNVPDPTRYRIKRQMHQASRWECVDACEEKDMALLKMMQRAEVHPQERLRIVEVVDEWTPGGMKPGGDRSVSDVVAARFADFDRGGEIDEGEAGATGAAEREHEEAST
jgi:hypothetical protein